MNNQWCVQEIPSQQVEVSDSMRKLLNRVQSLQHLCGLLSEDLETLLQLVLGLRPRLLSLWFAEHQLCLHTPSGRNVEFRLETDIDEWIVMLQIAAQAFSVEGGPHHVLMHAVGLFRPYGKCEQTGMNDRG